VISSRRDKLRKQQKAKIKTRNKEGLIDDNTVMQERFDSTTSSNHARLNSVAAKEIPKRQKFSPNTLPNHQEVEIYHFKSKSIKKERTHRA